MQRQPVAGDGADASPITPTATLTAQHTSGTLPSWSAQRALSLRGRGVPVPAVHPATLGVWEPGLAPSPALSRVQAGRGFR